MKPPRKSHAEVVDEWLGPAFSTRTSMEMFAVLGVGFEVIWKRAHRTLGDVTLRAIGERVLLDAVARTPWLDGVELDDGGLQHASVGAAEVASAEMAEAVRRLLVDLLSVIGNLTAEVLTGPLHAELMKTKWHTGGLVQSSGKGKKS